VLVSTPLRPGTTSVVLDYSLHYDGEELELDLPTAYDTETVQILIPVGLTEEEIDVTAGSAPLLDAGVATIGGRDYHIWSVRGLSAGDQLALTITGLPRPPSANRLSTLEPAIVAGLALAIAVAVTGWIVVQRGLARPRPIALSPAASVPLDVRREQLSTELRRLEADRVAGEVDEGAYATHRRTILEELRRISRQYRGLGDDE
jgi:hypothetical protein